MDNTQDPFDPSAYRVRDEFTISHALLTLSLDHQATDTDIRKRFHELSRSSHPDRHPEGQKEIYTELFGKYNNAYRLLLNLDELPDGHETQQPQKNTSPDKKRKPFRESNQNEAANRKTGGKRNREGAQEETEGNRSKRIDREDRKIARQHREADKAMYAREKETQRREAAAWEIRKKEREEEWRKKDEETRILEEELLRKACADELIRAQVLKGMEEERCRKEAEEELNRLSTLESDYIEEMLLRNSQDSLDEVMIHSKSKTRVLFDSSASEESSSDSEQEAIKVAERQARQQTEEETATKVTKQAEEETPRKVVEQAEEETPRKVAERIAQQAISPLGELDVEAAIRLTSLFGVDSLTSLHAQTDQEVDANDEETAKQPNLLLTTAFRNILKKILLAKTSSSFPLNNSDNSSRVHRLSIGSRLRKAIDESNLLLSFIFFDKGARHDGIANYEAMLKDTIAFFKKVFEDSEEQEIENTFQCHSNCAVVISEFQSDDGVDGGYYRDKRRNHNIISAMVLRKLPSGKGAYIDYLATTSSNVLYDSKPWRGRGLAALLLLFGHHAFAADTKTNGSGDCGSLYLQCNGASTGSYRNYGFHSITLDDEMSKLFFGNMQSTRQRSMSTMQLIGAPISVAAATPTANWDVYERGGLLRNCCRTKALRGYSEDDFFEFDLILLEQFDIFEVWNKHEKFFAKCNKCEDEQVATFIWDKEQHYFLNSLYTRLTNHAVRDCKYWNSGLTSEKRISEEQMKVWAEQKKMEGLLKEIEAAERPLVDTPHHKIKNGRELLMKYHRCVKESSCFSGCGKQEMTDEESVTSEDPALTTIKLSLTRPPKFSSMTSRAAAKRISSISAKKKHKNANSSFESTTTIDQFTKLMFDGTFFIGANVRGQRKELSSEFVTNNFTKTFQLTCKASVGNFKRITVGAPSSVSTVACSSYCGVIAPIPTPRNYQQLHRFTCAFSPLASCFLYFNDAFAHSVIANNTLVSLDKPNRFTFAIELLKNKRLKYDPVVFRNAQYNIFKSDFYCWPTLIRLASSDGGEAHSIAVAGDWLFDSNLPEAAKISISILDWCSSSDEKGSRFSHVSEAVQFINKKPRDEWKICVGCLKKEKRCVWAKTCGCRINFPCCC